MHENLLQAMLADTATQFTRPPAEKKEYKRRPLCQGSGYHPRRNIKQPSSLTLAQSRKRKAKNKRRKQARRSNR